MPCRRPLRVSSSLWSFYLLLFVFATVVAFGQQQPQDQLNVTGGLTRPVPSYEIRNGAPLILKVFSENSRTRLDRQALVKLTNQTLQTVSWQTTTDQAEAMFDLELGQYQIEVSAVGYLPTQKDVQLINALTPVRFEIVLQKDPSAVQLNVKATGIPPKARKETKRAISGLKSAKWNDANKHLDAAYKMAPENPDLNFLLGYLYFQKNSLDRAADFLDKAAALSPHNVQALTLLGRLRLQQDDYGRAVFNLEKAVLADSDYWLAHDLLAASYLRQRKYDKARDEAQVAISKGEKSATASQLVLGQALVNLGQKQEGIQSLKDFVAAAPKNPSVPQVRALIAQLEAAPVSANADQGNSSLPAQQPMGIDPLIAAAQPTFSVRPWQPPPIDLNKPAVAADVSCPADLLAMISTSIEEFVGDVSRIAAIEHLLHEQLDEMGDPITKESRTFNYVASFAASKHGSVAVDEYRQEHLGLADFPDQIASSGFPALALVFHPNLRDNYEMACEGLGELRGRPTWLVHFKQRGDRPAQIHYYRIDDNRYPLALKGRAWISADKFQLMRIESELVSPMPQIRLAGEHAVVEYGPVPFKKRNVQLWLPQTAEIYLDFRRHRYYRKHSFDHYMLFAVDADEKQKVPPAKPAADQPQPN